MVRIAQNCNLPCNPTPEERKTYENDYKFAKQLVMLSEDKLKMRLKSFFNNHLSELVQTYSLINKGPKSKIFRLQNTRNKSMMSERKQTLQNLCSYFEQNEKFLKDVERDMRQNFHNQIEEIFLKIQASIQAAFDMYEIAVKKQMESIRSQIKKNVSSLQKEMQRLETEQVSMIVQTVDEKLTNSQISSFLKISQQDVKGYEAIFKMIDKRSPLMRKIGILEENFNESDELSCQRQIDGLNINCDFMSCGEMWNVVQLMKKKRDFNTSFSYEQNSLALSNSFTSFQGAQIQNSMSQNANEKKLSSLNPEVEYNQQQMVHKYQNSLKEVENKIIHKLYGILHNRKTIVSNENHNASQQIKQSKQKVVDEPLALYLNQNELYRILYQTKQIVECEFEKMNQKNKQMNLELNINEQKCYYEPLCSSSQKGESDDEEEKSKQNQRQMQSSRKSSKSIGKISRKNTSKSRQDRKQKKSPLVVRNEKSRRQKETPFVRNEEGRKETPFVRNEEGRKETPFVRNEEDRKETPFVRNEECRKETPFVRNNITSESHKDIDSSQIQTKVPSHKYSQTGKVASKVYSYGDKDQQINDEPQDQKLKQEKTQNISRQNQTSMRSHDQTQSRFHYATDSENQSDKQNDNESVEEDKQQIKQQQSNLEVQSPTEQYNEYVNKMKSKGSVFQEANNLKNQKQIQKQLIKQKEFERQQKIYNDHQKKLYPEQNQSQNTLKPLYENDPSDIRLRSYFDNDDQEEQQHQKYNSSRSKYHNLNEQKKSISYSQIERDPESQRTLQQWKKGRRNQTYEYLRQEKQKQQDIIQYVSYDYDLENERQKPYQGNRSVKEEYLYNPRQHMQNVLPEQISMFSDINIQEQRRIAQEIQRNRNPPRKTPNQPQQEKPFMKKIGTIVKDALVPGFYALKNQRQNKVNSTLKKQREQEEFQRSMLQIAIQDSLQTQQNQNPQMTINDFSSINPIRQTNPRRQQVPERKNQLTRNDPFRQNEENFQEKDFTQFLEFFKGLSQIKAPFSLQQNSGFNFLEDLEQEAPSSTSRKRQNNELRIQYLKSHEEELSISKEEFSIVVKVLKPVLLTFRNLDRRKNAPMAKYLVGDETGIAVIYMKYYCDVKPGSCLKLNRCRICNFRDSFEITNMSRISTANVLPGNFIPKINFTNALSLIRGNTNSQLSYEVRPAFNDVLKFIVRDLKRNNGQLQKLIQKPLIVTVCDANMITKRYVFGDYTGRIMADFSNFNKVLLCKNETVLIRNIRICIRGDQILLVAQRNTIVLKADFDWQFKHDLQYIPNEQFKA